MTVAHITILDRLYISIRVLAGILMIYYFGILIGLTLCFISSWSYGYVTAYLFNVEALSLFDYGMFNEHEKSRNNVSCMIVGERMPYEDFKQVWTDKVIKNLPKFSSKPIKILGTYYTKRISIQEASDCIVKVEEKFSNKEELEDFVAKRINHPFELDKPN